MIRPSTDRTTVVDTELHWIDLTVQPPPRGQRVLLINRAAGSATTGQWLPSTEFTHWFPFPTFKKEGSDER